MKYSHYSYYTSSHDRWSLYRGDGFHPWECHYLTFGSWPPNFDMCKDEAFRTMDMYYKGKYNEED